MASGESPSVMGTAQNKSSLPCCRLPCYLFRQCRTLSDRPIVGENRDIPYTFIQLRYAELHMTRHMRYGLADDGNGARARMSKSSITNADGLRRGRDDRAEWDIEVLVLWRWRR